MVFLFRKRRDPPEPALFQPPKETQARRDSIDRQLERDRERLAHNIAGGALSVFSLMAGVNPMGGPMDFWQGHDQYGGR
jgi:hypothetical protein